MSINQTFQPLISALLLVMFASSALAAECSAIFPSVVQTAGNAGSIEIKNNGHLYGIEEIAGERFVYTKTLSSHATACNDDTCTRENSPAEKGAFNSFPGGADLVISDSMGYSLSPGDYNSLTLIKDSILILSPGQYTFKKGVVFEDDTKINIASSGSVQFYGKEIIDIQKRVQINQTGDGGRLFMFSAKEIVIGEASHINGLLYAEAMIDVQSGTDASNLTTLFGSFSTQKELVVSAYASVTFDETAIAETDFGGFCESAPQATVDHYAISYDGGSSYAAADGVTCEASYVTVVAHGSTDDHQPVTPEATTTMTLTTLPNTATWSDSGTNSITHTFDGSTSSVTLALQQTDVATININVNNSSGNGDEDPGEDASISFADAVFLFYSDGVANAIGTQIAGKPSNQLPGNQTLQLRAVRTNDDTGACEALLSDNETVQVAYQCSDPDTCQAGNRVVIHGNGSTAITGNPASSVSSYTDVQLDFGDDGIAPFSFDYSDAGKLILHANKQIEAEGDNPEATLAGTSNSFIVRPFGFYLDVIDNSAAEDAGGDPFKIAGDVFTTDVSAVVWQAEDDDGSSGGVANDGIPDSNEALEFNATTPNFGQESAADTVMIDHLLVAPDGGDNPELIEREFSGFSNGTSSNDGMSWSEVGIISFAADLSDKDYLGSGESVIGTVDSVGRFYPDHFELITSALTNRSDLVGCVDSDFTYLHESFNSTMTLQANNIDDLVTKNYTDDFAKLITYEQLGFGVLGDDVDLTSRLEQGTNSAIINWPTVDNTQAGIGSIDVDLMLLRNTLPDGPDTEPDGPFELLQVGIAPDDGDAVLASFDLDINGDGSNDYAEVGQTEVYFGRIRIENAFGPETEPLTMTALVEYWNGSAFVTNPDDNCSELAITTDPVGPDGITVGSGSSDMTNNTPVLAGDLGINFSAPGAGNSGDINVRLHTVGEPADSGIDSLPWLQFDWDNDGRFDDDPGGRIATFGRYRGNDRVFFWRENN
ncbi:MAG: DUF6701 domain-containing protein [Motiliproteus sp.]